MHSLILDEMLRWLIASLQSETEDPRSNLEIKLNLNLNHRFESRLFFNT